MGLSAKEFVNTPKFKAMVAKRWTFSFLMLGLLFLMYYGYLIVVALDLDFLSSKLFEGGATTYGMILGVAVIFGSWLLTILYVVWANTSYDKAVEELKQELR